MPATPRRIALLEVGHHHTGLVADGIRKLDHEVAAVSDRDPAMARRWADRLGCEAYDDYRALLDSEAVDFVFAFGPHREMPALALALIERGMPFSIEKPLGICADDVERVCARQAASGLFVSIPFVFRCCPMVEQLRALKDAERIGRPLHMRFVDLAGGPGRYADIAPWLCDPHAAGGGCFVNLAVHFIDLFILLGGETPQVAGSRYSNALHGLPVEDHAVVVLANGAGGTCSIEVGYAFPDDTRRIQSYGFAGAGWHVAVADGRLQLDQAQRSETIEIVTDTNTYYPTYVKKTLDAWAAGSPPIAAPVDLLKVMRIVDRANTLGFSQLPT